MIRRAALLAVVMVTMTACTTTPTGTKAVTGTASSADSVAGCRPLNSTVAAHPDPASAARALSTLTAFAGVGWNSAAPTVRPSTLTGGVFINFRPSWNGSNDASVNTNITTAGESDDESGSTPRHDPLADLAILRNIDALLSTGVRQEGLDEMRCNLQPVTAAEFATYGVERGWIYNALIDLSHLDSNGPWLTQAKTFAVLLAKRFGTGINPDANFRPDWIAESASALTDAGKRFGEARWTSIGHQLALQLCRTTADPSTGFFPGQAHLTTDGQATVVDPLVKVGSQAQLVDALLSVYDDTKDQTVLDAARKNLASLQSPSIGIADAEHGGWFYAVDVDGTKVRKNYKETRQAWMVDLLRHAAANGLVPAGVATSVTKIVREQLYQPDSHGYVYRVRADWSPYVTTQKGKRVQENWVSSEATGIAVQALLGPLT